MDKAFMSLDHIHTAGLSSAHHGPAALFIILAPSVPVVEPSPDNKPPCGVHPKACGR